MASVSTSHLILFIASMVIAGSVAGVFVNEVHRMSGALTDQSMDVSSDIRTDVQIISDPQAGNVYNGSEISLLVKNIGTQRLDSSRHQVDILVNGEYVSKQNISVQVVAGGPSWGVSDVVEITVTFDLAAGDHRVLVIVNGDREVLEFRT